MRDCTHQIAKTTQLLQGKIRQRVLRIEQAVPHDGKATQQGTGWSWNCQY